MIVAFLCVFIGFGLILWANLVFIVIPLLREAVAAFRGVEAQIKAQNGLLERGITGYFSKRDGASPKE